MKPTWRHEASLWRKLNEPVDLLQYRAASRG